MSLSNERRENRGSGGLLSVAKLQIADALQRAGKLASRERIQTAVHPRTEFRDLPVFSAMEKHREIARTMGVSNPFYRVHERREGALTWMGGQPHINYASYDYLGLAQHPAVSEAAKAAINQYGMSVSASRIVAGERPVHGELESAIAEFYGTEAAVVFVSGHATNVSTIDALMKHGDLIVHDELIHNSAHVGAQLSGAACKSFRHNDMDSLEKVLAENRSKHNQALIVVEGLYSMDGDFPDLARLVELKNRYGCWLMIDEAHSLGVLGDTGKGIAEHFGIDFGEIDIWMGTLSKTLGTCGGYIAGCKELIEILRFQAAGFVYSVGMPPAISAAALKALEILKAEPERVKRLQANSRLFLEEARAAGLDTATAEGYAVVPVIVGDSLKAVKMTESLLERGINALPIIYPAVPMKLARLRFFITADHTPEQIKETVAIAREELDKVSKGRFTIAAFMGR
ncbi:MAG: hypothetical protein RLZ98_2553 [Pseudomonadota bacterium]|jgi:8-amino-7-oxononanoate synthase